MKKVLILITILLVVIFVAAEQFLGSALKGLAISGLQSIITTKAELRQVRISLARFTITFSGLSIQSPENYRTKNFLAIDSGEIRINPLSFFSDVVEVDSIVLYKPSFNVELDEKGVSNNFRIFKRGPRAKQPAANPKKSKRLLIKRLSVRDGDYSLVNYKVNQKGARAYFDKIDMEIRDLTPQVNPDDMPTVVTCKARLPSQDLAGEIEFRLMGGLLVKEIDFELDFAAKNISLPYFMPFYVNTAPIIAKTGTFELRSMMRCRNNVLSSIQKVDLEGLAVEMNDGANTNRSFFGIPVYNVVNYFVNNQGNMIFEFNIDGTMDKPVFHLGEALQAVITKSIGDQILGTVSDTVMNTVDKAGKIGSAGKEVIKGVLGQ